MTTLDRRLKEHVEEMLRQARPDQLRKLLEDIAQTEREPVPTHQATERLQ